MKKLVGGLTALAALVSAPVEAAAAKPVPKAGAVHDWTRTFGVSKAGGFVMGNPNARVKVVEYGSLTCPHCRHFAENAVSKFTSQYIRTGRASYEYRPMARDATDLAAFLLSRCGGPSHFFAMAETLYATQPTWTGRTVDLSEADLAKIPDNQIALRMAEKAQLFAVAQANGIAPAKARACLLDPAKQAQIASIYQGAIDAGVPGTPFFIINGKQTQVYDWKTLQAELKRAGG